MSYYSLTMSLVMNGWILNNKRSAFSDTVIYAHCVGKDFSRQKSYAFVLHFVGWRATTACFRICKPAAVVRHRYLQVGLLL